ncbi:MAG: M15 family metallopeptidase [Prevotellaceae bacterium]|jgi:D-alanyl-D-alanine dipeptidase|nr:M15 family metallopeptidase [Prevotellaceae bacterium]
MKKHINTGLHILNKALVILLLCRTICFSQDNGAVSVEAQQMENAGLVNVRDLDTSIVVQLLYATENNFVGEQIYRSLREAYLQVETANKLVHAQQYLKQIHSEWKLIVYDAARPQQAQEIMWNKVKNTPMKRYVTSPQRISMHTYGVAVDVSILDGYNRELDMGTPVDFLGSRAEPANEAKCLASGELTAEQVNNRKLLRTVMKKAGFRGISNEWWHFEAFTRAEAREKYAPVK